MPAISDCSEIGAGNDHAFWLDWAVEKAQKLTLHEHG
jgi:hypothetical protein